MPSRENVESTLHDVVRVVRDIVNKIKEHLPAIPEGEAKKEAVSTLSELEWANGLLERTLMTPNDKSKIDLSAIQGLLDTGCTILGALKNTATTATAKMAFNFAASRLQTQAVRLSACKMS